MFTRSWSPTDISGCQLWLDVDQGITKDGSDYVSSWADQSGNNNNATQGTGSYQPQLQSTSIGSAIFFDGTDNYLTLGTQLGKPANWTIFIVMAMASTTSSQFVLASSDAANNLKSTWGYIRYYSGTYRGIYGDDVSYSITNSVDTQFTSSIFSQHTIRYIDGDTKVDLWKTGTTQAVTIDASGANSCEGTAYEMAIGRCGAYNGEYARVYVAELIIYNAALSNNNIDLVEGYLREKYPSLW